MILAITALIIGLALLVWSADRFVDGAAASAKHFGMSPLLIGMVIIGLGTSAPEMVVSAFAASQGNPGLALGNAYGSNITNIALVLGLTALISPIQVHSQIVRKELPILTGITLLAIWQVLDGEITRLDAVILLLTFFALMGWSIWQSMRSKNDQLAKDMEHEVDDLSMTLRQALLWLGLGLLLLIVSSRILVWGAVTIAQSLGVSDLIIGLTIVAIGTSLPELAAAIAATRKGEHDLAIGNVIGSNMFNTLVVVGIAGAIHPMQVASEVLTRDMGLMFGLTILLFALCYEHRGQRWINRIEGGLLLFCYVAYMTYLASSVLK